MLLLDRATLDPKEVDALLTAIADLRAAGGSVIAVCPKPTGASGNETAGGGVAVVALACDGLVFETGARLEGAARDWCGSATKRSEIAEKLARLGRLDKIFAQRIVDCTTALSWSSFAGFAANDFGTVALARAGEAMPLTASVLQSVRIESREFRSVQYAFAAIERGACTARPDSSAPPARPTTPASPNAPAAPSAPKSSPLDPAVEAKVSPKMKEYDAALAELKLDLKEFDGYFRGAAGRWTTKNGSLKEVWIDKSDNTRDAQTKLRCERLQRALKEGVSKLAGIAKSVDRILKDREHPIAMRVRENQPSLDGLRDALEHNDSDDFEKFRDLVAKLK